MGDLEQQIRELSKDRFESFVNHYLIDRYPGGNIRRVDGSGGDDGIDTFSGLLACGPAIWQSKHFPNRIRQPQKKQILNSITVAIRENAPSVWTLCVPINLRKPEHEWFEEKVVAVFGGPERIKLIQASDFLAELRHNRSLRDAFFPEDALSKMMDLRRVIMSTEGRTQQQLGDVVAQYANQYLDESASLEPRLRPVMSIGGTPEMRLPARQPGLVWSITEGERTTHLFARDPASFNLDPIKLSIGMPPQYSMELDTAIDTGRPFTMPAGNILHVHTSSPLLNAHFEESNLHHWQFEVRPSVPQELADKDIPLRLIAGSGGRAKQISYIPFRVTRMGRAEIALSSKSQLPIEVSLTVPVSKDVSCTFRARPLLRRADVQALHDVLEFLDEVAQSGELEIVSLEANSIISKATREKTLSAIGVSPIVKHITAESALISRALNVPLYLGDRITEEEVGDLPILRAIVTGEEFAGARVTSSFLKDYGSREHVLEILKVSSFSLKLYFPAGSRRFQVFGTPVEVGPLKLTADKTNFVDPDEILNRYDAAQIGERVLFQAHCSGPCRWSRLISEQQSPSAA